ncbi:MAG: DUF4411 family protein [Spirochaetaceae bacterium]|nr:DUF4411 family protein [Spirochaetaceae bacterium]
MLYLLDANVLIDADRDYYPLNRVPEFWAWIVDRATKDQTKIPLEMCEEVLKGKVLKGKDDLPNWLKTNRDVMQLPENANARIVTHVTESGYAPDLTDQEVERIGLDPFLIAYALVDPTQRIVVTNRGGNRPDQPSLASRLRVLVEFPQAGGCSHEVRQCESRTG